MHGIIMYGARAQVMNGLDLPYPWTGQQGKVHVREYSFLDNPRLPQETKARFVSACFHTEPVWFDPDCSTMCAQHSFIWEWSLLAVCACCVLPAVCSFCCFRCYCCIAGLLLITWAALGHGGSMYRLHGWL